MTVFALSDLSTLHSPWRSGLGQAWQVSAKKRGGEGEEIYACMEHGDARKRYCAHLPSPSLKANNLKHSVAFVTISAGIPSRCHGCAMA
eukprot:757579-Hanusia_phi.AAC.1